MASDDKFGRLRQLVDSGKEKGYVLYDEVNDLLPDDIATGPAIATVGAAATDELFAMKADATTSAIAADDPYFCLVDEFHHAESKRKPQFNQSGLHQYVRFSPPRFYFTHSQITAPCLSWAKKKPLSGLSVQCRRFPTAQAARLPVCANGPAGRSSPRHRLAQTG